MGADDNAAAAKMTAHSGVGFARPGISRLADLGMSAVLGAMAVG